MAHYAWRFLNSLFTQDLRFSISCTGSTDLGDNMTTSQTLNHSASNLSSLRDYFVSETEYWEKYYNAPDIVYEWKNGYLEEKAVSDVLTILMYKWFFKLLEQYLETNPIAQSVVLEMGFRLSRTNEVRRPDLGVVLNNNPIPLLPYDRSYHGIYDMCIEALSDSTDKTKKDEYAKAGVKEYYILDANRKRLQFYRLSKARGVYKTIKPQKSGIIKSKVLPGFQFRIEDLFTKPSPDEMINDKVYQEFVLPGYLKEKQARLLAEEQARIAIQEAEQRTKQLAEQLRALGIKPIL